MNDSVGVRGFRPQQTTGDRAVLYAAIGPEMASAQPSDSSMDHSACKLSGLQVLVRRWICKVGTGLLFWFGLGVTPAGCCVHLIRKPVVLLLCFSQAFSDTQLT